MTAYRLRCAKALLTTDLADLAWLYELLGYSYKTPTPLRDLGVRRTIAELAELAYDLTV